MKFCSDPIMMELSLGQTGLSAPLPLLIDQGILIRGVCTAGYPLCFLVLMLPTTVVHIYAKSDDRKSSGAGLHEILPSDQGFLVLNLISDQLVIFQRLLYRTLNRMPTKPAWYLGPQD